MGNTQELLRDKEELRLMLKVTKEWLAQDGQWIAGKYSDILTTRFGHTVMHQPSLRAAVMDLMSVITATFLTGYYRGQEDLRPQVGAGIMNRARADKGDLAPYLD